MNLYEEIQEAAKRSAWVRVMTPANADADSISRDPNLLRLIWTDEQAKVLEQYFLGEQDPTPELKEDAHRIMDEGKIPFSELIDIFFKAKSAYLKELGAAGPREGQKFI